MRILGIDYGEKRIGIAFSDEAGEFALPHAVIKNSKTAPDEIAELAKKNKVRTIVVGESKDYSGKDNPVQEKIDVFCKELKQRSLTVKLEPEFMTSVAAERLQGKNKLHDASAAALILQSYLDRRKNP